MLYTLITGASKGIGKAMAEQLAAKKHHLLLIARTAELLENLAETLKKEFNIQVDYLAIDLADQGASQTIFSWCQANNYQINILINNAGYGNSGHFELQNAKMLLISFFKKHNFSYKFSDFDKSYKLNNRQKLPNVSSAFSKERLYDTCLL